MKKEQIQFFFNETWELFEGLLITLWPFIALLILLMGNDPS